MNKTHRSKIMIVDDVMFQLLSTKERLKNNYEVYPAQSADIMLDLLQYSLPELIILDINMPHTDGYEVLTMLKEDDRYSHIPVIFLTSQDSVENMVRALKLGAADFITKPYTDTELINAIEQQINPAEQSKIKPTILAIDDNPSILKSINAILHSNHTIYTLPTPTKIRELLIMVNPDLFILDYNMPVMTGFDLVPIIREQEEHKYTPIIFLTSESTKSNMVQAVALGANDFLAKPIDDVLLHEKVTYHLRGCLINRKIANLIE
ncbi:MAG: response regulator [Oscillospiraceae bacterium]|jgi:two-component system cell cycle response regulator|nr:response regulator [Oscillospiraceae bacterium]